MVYPHLLDNSIDTSTIGIHQATPQCTGYLPHLHHQFHTTHILPQRRRMLRHICTGRIVLQQATTGQSPHYRRNICLCHDMVRMQRIRLQHAAQQVPTQYHVLCLQRVDIITVFAPHSTTVPMDIPQ